MNSHLILLVEDDAAVRALARVALETFGAYRVCACASGAEALQRAPGQKFDLLLLDVIMPGMGGVETLAALRHLPGLALVPVVFLTGRTQAHELEAYRSYGVADVIAKPFDPRSLFERIERVLQASKPAQATKQAGPEALLIEDDLSIAYLVQFVLEEQGYRVRSATDGDSGRQAIEAGPTMPTAVVVLDLTLPHEDGLQLLTRLRADPRWQQVPVLVLSARRDESTMQQAFAAGADDYLNKPFDPYQVGARIKQLIEGSRRSPTQAAPTS